MINRALVRGSPGLAELGRKHHVSPQALTRHKAHLPPAMVATQSDVTAEHGSQLLNDIGAMRVRVEALLTEAETKGDTRGAVTAIREGTRLIELIAKLQGALTPPPAVQINLHQSVEFQTVIGTLIEALTPYPEARSAVTTALMVH